MDKILSQDEIIEKSVPIFQKHPFVKRAYLFGSYARGTANEHSDLDFFVELAYPVGIIFFGLNEELNDTFGMWVDVLTTNEVNELLEQNLTSTIRKDAILVYEYRSTVHMDGQHFSSDSFISCGKLS